MNWNDEVRPATRSDHVENLLGEAVGEVLLVLVRTHVDEEQDCEPLRRANWGAASRERRLLEEELVAVAEGSRIRRAVGRAGPHGVG